MSVQVLFDLQQELRRLLVAGSGLASGDLNLKKQLPQLQKLGEASPVFKRLAQGVQEIIESERNEAAGKLLDVSMLLNSVLYTQGRTEAVGELFELPGTEITMGTPIPYRKLEPVLDALTRKGQGRWEVLRQAEEEGLLKDLRLIPASVSALEDSYGELADFVQRKVIPLYGREALPVLRKQLRLSGGKGDARRLELLHGLLGDEAEALELLLEGAQEGSVAVRTAAIELLGGYPEQEDFLLAQSEEKSREVRRSAYRALSRLGSERAQERLFQALRSAKDRELVWQPIWMCDAEGLQLRVVRLAKDTLDKLVADGPGEAGDKTSYDLLTTCLYSIEGKNIPEALELLKELLSLPGKLTEDMDRVQDRAVGMLLQLDTPEAYRAALELQSYRNGRYIGYSLRGALRILTPEEVYDRYAPVLDNKRTAAAKELLRTLEDILPPQSQQITYRPLQEGEELQQVAFDDRWLPLLIRIDQVELVCRLAQAPDPEVAAYLADKCREIKDLRRYENVELLLALFKVEHPEASELLIALLERTGGRQIYYLDDSHIQLLRQLPAAYADRLLKAAEAFTYESVKNRVRELAEELVVLSNQSEMAN